MRKERIGGGGCWDPSTRDEGLGEGVHLNILQNPVVRKPEEHVAARNVVAHIAQQPVGRLAFVPCWGAHEAAASERSSTIAEFILERATVLASIRASIQRNQQERPRQMRFYVDDTDVYAADFARVAVDMNDGSGN